MIVVCLKASTRTDVPLRLDAAGRAVRDEDTAPAPGGRNLAPLAQALALKAAVPGAESIMVLSVAPPAGEALLREALAHGADRALRVWGEGWSAGAGEDGSAATTGLMARAAAEAIAPLAPALVLAGDKSGDSGHECFGAFLAKALAAPLAHRAVEIAREAAGWRVRVKLERGYTQELDLARGAVATVAGQTQPLAYPSLPTWLAGLRADIPAVSVNVRETSVRPTLLRPPLPRVKRYVVPEETLDAEGRIRSLVELPAGGGGVVLGPEMEPAAQAAELAQFLRKQGYA